MMIWNINTRKRRKKKHVKSYRDTGFGILRRGEKEKHFQFRLFFLNDLKRNKVYFRHDWVFLNVIHIKPSSKAYSKSLENFVNYKWAELLRTFACLI